MSANSADPPASIPRAARAGRAGPWWRTLAWLVLAVVVAALTATAAANLLVTRMARPYLHTGAAEVSAPVAIVPGASVHRDGTPSPQLEGRLAAALALVRAGKVQQVLVSGARNGAYDEAGAMRRWLTQRGLPSTAVVDDHAGFRTLDTMQRAARVFGVQRAVVCTQAFHLPRAVFLARRAGIDAMGFPADGRSRDQSAADLAREALASLMAVVDSYVLHRQPREPGLPPKGTAVREEH